MKKKRKVKIGKEERWIELMANKNEYAQWLWKYVFLLWWIAYSQFLSDHLKLLATTEMLSILTMLMDDKSHALPADVRLCPGLDDSSSDDEDNDTHEGEDNNKIGEEFDIGIFKEVHIEGLLIFPFQHCICMKINHWTYLNFLSKHQTKVQVNETQNVKLKISLLLMGHPANFD